MAAVIVIPEQACATFGQIGFDCLSLRRDYAAGKVKNPRTGRVVNAG
jgi:hypothetical protein